MERQDAKPAKNAKVRHVQREPSPELDTLAQAVIGAAIEVERDPAIDIARVARASES